MCHPLPWKQTPPDLVSVPLPELRPHRVLSASARRSVQKKRQSQITLGLVAQPGNPSRAGLSHTRAPIGLHTEVLGPSSRVPGTEEVATRREGGRAGLAHGQRSMETTTYITTGEKKRVIGE